MQDAKKKPPEMSETSVYGDGFSHKFSSYFGEFSCTAQAIASTFPFLFVSTAGYCTYLAPATLPRIAGSTPR